MEEPSVPLGPPTVPVFLTKLWVLVEDPANCDVIAWNLNGQNFRILDEQRFSKEILPKYFKHNNLSSFIRQLNMYGFRKVMSLENGLVKTESSIEFQHPFFKKGRPELLEQIKRKVNTVKTEDSHQSQDNLQKVLNELRQLQDGQANMNVKLETMKRENEILWQEVSSLRRRHSQQQKLLAKILQFILSLMKGNILMGSNRKRPLTIEASQTTAPKYSRSMLQLVQGGANEENQSSNHRGSTTNNYLVIHKIPSAGEGTSAQLSEHKYHIPASQESLKNTEQVILIDKSDVDLQLEVEESHSPSSSFLAQDQVMIPDVSLPVADQSVVPSNSTEAQRSLISSSSATGEEWALDLVQDNASEDPESVIVSILNENVSSSNSDIFDREEIQDFLNCIDASLEDIQNILNKKNVNSDFLEELFKTDLLSSDNTMTKEDSSLGSGVSEQQKEVPVLSRQNLLNKGKQLVQYTGNPLLSLFDDMPQSSYGEGSSDPGHLLNVIDDTMIPVRSEEQIVTKEADLAVEDYHGSHVLSPIYVLSPVSKLIEEATEPDTV